MTSAFVIALTSFVVYGVLAGYAPDLARDLGIAYAIVILAAWLILSHGTRRRE